MKLGDRLLEWLQARDRRRGARACRICGCTDRYGCRPAMSGPGCSWIQFDLCSRCGGVDELFAEMREGIL